MAETEAQVKEVVKTTIAETDKLQDSSSNSSSNDIELITEEEYNKLSEEEKAEYIRYNPSMSDEAVAALIKQANAQMAVLGQLAPAIEKIKVMPQPLPAEQINKALDSFEKAMKLVDPIEQLVKVEPIGTLAKPVVAVLNATFQVIGMAFLIEFYLARGATIFTDQICEAWDNLNVDKIADDIKEVKEMAEEQKTAGIKQEIDIEKLPTEEMKKKVSELEDSVEMMTSTLDIMGAATRAMDITVKAVYSQMSYEQMMKNIGKTLGKLGVDTSPLEQPTAEQTRAFDKLIPSPKVNMEKMKKSLDGLKNDKKYISIDDMSKLNSGGAGKKVSLSDKLSEHFTVNDLCYSDEAKKAGIENLPGEKEVENLKLLCQNILEPVYAHYGRPIITSGFRTLQLNKIINPETSQTGQNQNISQHCYGQAADIEVYGVMTPDLADWIAKNCEYDQIIVEKCTKLYCDPNSGWVHVSYKKSGNRHEKWQTPTGRKPYTAGFPKIPKNLA